MNKAHRGHRPRLIDAVLKRLGCEDCGTSWFRGKVPPGPCPGAERAITPVLGVQPALRGGLYRGRAKDGT